MVRDVQYSDESESDWDSLSQAVPPATTVESTQPSLGKVKTPPFSFFSQ